MKIQGVIFDVGQTLSNQLDKERLEERNKKYYAYVYQQIISKDLTRLFEHLETQGQENFVKDLNTLNMLTRAEKNRSIEVLTEYRMSEQTLEILIKFEENAGKIIEKNDVKDQVLPVLDEIYSGTEALDGGVYELWPDTKEVLEYLRGKGYVLGLASNTAHPVKHEHMLARLGITPLIDHFAISSYIGVRKPNPEMMKILLKKMNLTEDQVIMVGDLLDRDILMGHLAGIRTVWINAIPYSLDQNLKRIREGELKYRPTAGIVCLSQLPGTIEYLDRGGFKGQLKVAYYFPSLRKKLETGKQRAFVSNDRIKYMPVELRAPIENLGEFDVIVHKVTDLLLSDNEDAKEGIRNLQNYLSTHPNVLVLDPIDSLQFTNYRSKLSTIWPELSIKGVTVRCPVLYTQSNCVFPCILKSDVACQVPHSHDMSILTDPDSLNKSISAFPLPYILQEWIDHSAMFKVYILGDYFQASPCKVISAKNEPIHFNSTKIPEDLKVNTDLSLDSEILSIINKTLKQTTGLGLLSYDLAVEKSSGSYIIVDLNYFPGYYTVENYPHLMDEYVLSSYLAFNSNR